MRNYVVFLPYYMTARVVITASSKRAAIRKAWELVDPHVCVHCAKRIEIDGEGDSKDVVAYVTEEEES